MKNHITSVIEFQEVGIVLEGPGQHVVRVMGALKTVQPPSLPASKEELSELVSREPFGPYYAEDTPGQPVGERLQPEDPQVPTLYVTREGKVVFLGRDLEDLA